MTFYQAVPDRHHIRLPQRPAELDGQALAPFRTRAEAKMAIFDYIEAWYNPKRRHSALGRVSPINYERRYHAAA